MVNDASIKVVKRSGEIEELNLDKIHNVVSWACEGIAGVSISEVELRSQLKFFDGITTREIHDTLTKTAADLITEESPNYQYVAAKLANLSLRKEVYGTHEPCSLLELVHKNINLGYYTSELLQWYTEAELNQLNKAIKHNRDFNFAYAGMQQWLDKYLVQHRITKQHFETPQMAYMLIAATALNASNHETRMTEIINFYDSLSLFINTLPTPILAGLRTPERQFSSCVVIDIGDSLHSIEAANTAIMEYVSRKAGIGLNIGNIRPAGSEVRNGKVVHTGLIPFAKSFQASLKSTSQGGIRGGAATNYFPYFHYEIESLLVLKNNKGSEETRIRHMDYGMTVNRLFYKRVLDDEKITLFSPHEVPDLMEAYYSGDNDLFEKLYVKYEKSTKLKQKRVMSAYALMEQFIEERLNTGRIYLMNLDHANQHGSYDSSKHHIKQSNLCLTGDTEIATHYGLLTLKSLYDDDKEFEVWSDTRAYEDKLQLGKYFDKTDAILEKSSKVVLTKINASVYEVILENGLSVKGTLDHQIMTSHGMVPIRDLRLGTIVYVAPWFSSHIRLTGDGTRLDKTVSTVRSLKYSGIEDVYDIAVENSHSFIANGIVVHNCTEINLPTRPLGSEKIETVTVNVVDEIEQLNTWIKDREIVTFDKISDDGRISTYNLHKNDGRIALCTLEGINWAAIKTPADFELPMRAAVRSLDAILEYQDYPVIESELSTREFRTLGIGVNNLAYFLAKNGLKYDDNALPLIDEYMEAMAFYAIKASVDLAKEKGPCELWKETKWASGQFPHERRKPFIDTLVPFKLRQDWEGLRKDLLQYGIRNASLLAIMPSESNSVLINATNGIEPPRAFVSQKKTKGMIVSQVVPEFPKLKNKYDLLWNQNGARGYLKVVAVLAKWCDQSISANTSYSLDNYPDGKIPYNDIIDDLVFAYAAGIKNLYYNNTNVGATDEYNKEPEAKTEQTGTLEQAEESEAECSACSL